MYVCVGGQRQGGKDITEAQGAQSAPHLCCCSICLNVSLLRRSCRRFASFSFSRSCRSWSSNSLMCSWNTSSRVSRSRAWGVCVWGGVEGETGGAEKGQVSETVKGM